MGSEWKKHKFSDLCNISRGASPRPIQNWITNKGIPWVKIADATSAGSRYIRKTNEFIRTEGKTKSVSVFPGDLILTNSATPGIPMLMGIEACIHDGWMLLRDFNGLDKLFAYYLLLYERSALVQQGNGSVFTNLKTEILKNHTVKIPDIPEQRAIAHILGTLDDKIELNRQQNKTLEDMARALFKAWFVDFEPVRAKMEGRWQRGQSLPGLPADIFDLFPDRLVESELGEIPEGWRMSDIKDCCMQVQNGGTPRRSENLFWEGGTIPWLTSGEVRQTIIAHTENFITEAGLRGSSAKWIPELSTVVALYGATAGQVSLVSFPLTTNQAVCALIPKDGFSYFNYLSMRNAVAEMEGKAVGSAQQNISKGIVEKIQVAYAPAMLMEKFSLMVEPFFDKWIANLRQSRTLAQLRDTLLPKLISGEVRVPSHFLKETK